MCYIWKPARLLQQLGLDPSPCIYLYSNYNRQNCMPASLSLEWKLRNSICMNACSVGVCSQPPTRLLTAPFTGTGTGYRAPTTILFDKVKGIKEKKKKRKKRKVFTWEESVLPKTTSLPSGHLSSISQILIFFICQFIFFYISLIERKKKKYNFVSPEITK